MSRRARSTPTLIDTIPEWDSMAHLNICLAIQDSFGIQLDMDTIGELTSVAALAKLVDKARAAVFAGNAPRSGALPVKTKARPLRIRRYQRRCRRMRLAVLALATQHELGADLAQRHASQAAQFLAQLADIEGVRPLAQ